IQTRPASTTPAPTSLASSGPASGDCSPNNMGANNTTPCVPAHVTASVQRTVRSNESNGLWVTYFRITTDIDMKTGSLRLTCSGACVRADIDRINKHPVSGGTNGPDPKDPNTVIYQLGPQPMASGQHVTLSVYSKEQVKVVSGSIGDHPIDFSH